MSYEKLPGSQNDYFRFKIFNSESTINIMPKIFISTVPFGELDNTPIQLLENSKLEYIINPLNRKLTADEVGKLAKDCDGLIAGTENIHVVLKTAVVLPPPVVNAWGARKWLEEYEVPLWTKKCVRRARLTVFD